MAKKEETFHHWLNRHLGTIKGLSLVIVGLLLIGITSPVIVRLLILMAGGFLVYSGLVILRARHITKFIDDTVRKIRKQ